MKNNGIKHIRCSPYHQSSNGQAERFVKSFKEAMIACENDSLALDHKIDNFLLTYRSPHATTGESPARLLLGHDLKTRLSLIRPSEEYKVQDKQSSQKKTHADKSKLREFHVGERVMVKNLRPGPKYVVGVILQKLAPYSYSVEVQHGLIWKRHVNHLLKLEDAEQDRQYSSNVPKDLEEEEEDIYLPFTGNNMPERIPPERIPPPSARQENSRHYPRSERRPPNRFAPYIHH